MHHSVSRSQYISTPIHASGFLQGEPGTGIGAHDELAEEIALNGKVWQVSSRVTQTESHISPKAWLMRLSVP